MFAPLLRTNDIRLWASIGNCAPGVRAAVRSPLDARELTNVTGLEAITPTNAMPSRRV